MVNRIKRNWEELQQELLNIKKNSLMVKILEYSGKKAHSVFNTDILKDLLEKLLLGVTWKVDLFWDIRIDEMVFGEAN